MTGPAPDTKERSDHLAVAPSTGSLLVFNYGDAAFLRVTRFHGDLPPHEIIFLRLISYLAFFDEVAPPARIILDSEPLMRAIDLAAPLLRTGIIRPERRSTTKSFSDLASDRQLGLLQRERAARLDEIAKNPRLFKFDDLQKKYIEILQHDLATGGAFRNSIRGTYHGHTAKVLDHAWEDYARKADGTPENFAQTLAHHEPHLAGKGLRWAMARYYSTPALFDDKNMREIPTPAADLLLSAHVKEQMSLPEPTIAPVDLMFQNLSASLPASRVTLDAERYCESVLYVREKLPEARRISRMVLKSTEAHAVSREVSEAFAKELRRQQRMASDPPSNRKLVVSSALIGALAGVVADIFVGIPGITSVPLGVGAGVAADRMQKNISQNRKYREAPWVIAVELMKQRTQVASFA